MSGSNKNNLPITKKKDEVVTLREFQQVLPRQCRKQINQTVVDSINKALKDSEARETFRDNLLSYVNVLQHGKFKMEGYINAVRYVSHKLMGDNNRQAYIKTFPNKYNNFIARGVKEKDIASYMTAYNKSKLVNLIYEQTLIPTYVLNAETYQKAINVQADLMVNARSEKVRSDAANSLLNHLKKPESTKIEMDIGVSQDTSVIDDLRKATQELAEQQLKNISLGISSTKEVAQSSLELEAEFETVENE